VSFFAEQSAPSESSSASKLRDLYGFVPRMFQAQYEIPHIAGPQIALLEALLANEQHLVRPQKEKLLLAVSAARRSSYGVALHAQTLRLLGTPDREIDHIILGGIPDGPDGELVACACSLIQRPLEFGQADIERLRGAGFNEQQIVETIVLIGFCDLLNTVQFGTGAAPDFARRPLPPQQENKMHPPAAESRPMVEEGQIDPASDPDGGDVVRAQAGDVNAFETLVQRHSQLVYRTLIGLLGNPDDAKDALQDTFLKAFQNLPRFERRAKFSTWLVSIAANTGLQQLRDRKQLESLHDDASDHEEFRPRQIRAWGDDPEQAYSKDQRRELVERGISRLPAKLRVVLLLRDVQQLSTDEAAAALGLSVPATKARLLRARLMLRENLAPHFSEGANAA
jgi:RNA polymerase sigma-70 factor (ECF subfamily)